MWNAAASLDVPVLSQLDLRTPVGGVKSARKRADATKVRAKVVLDAYASRFSAESLRKLVK